MIRIFSRKWGVWPSGIRRDIQNRKLSVLTPLGARLGFGTQPFYKVPGDLQFEISKRIYNDLFIVKLIYLGVFFTLGTCFKYVQF